MTIRTSLGQYLSRKSVQSNKLQCFLLSVNPEPGNKKFTYPLAININIYTLTLINIQTLFYNKAFTF